MRTKIRYAGIRVQSAVNADIKTEPVGVDFAGHVPAPAAGAVDQFFGAARLRTEVGGFAEGTVSTHSAAKQDFF